MINRRLAVVHFYPLEFFPPVTNLLKFFSSKPNELKINVFTTHNNKGRNIYREVGIEIKRCPFPSVKNNRFVRGLTYFYFNCYTLIQLILKRPQFILYYETISCWPVYVYSKFINRKCDILIHFHEYASLDWYSKFMKLVKYYHKLETSYLYSKAIWISQTNRHRLQLFLDDNPNIDSKKLKILPNYPPKNWIKRKKLRKGQPNRKIVYIGSLSFEGTFIYEFCNWVNSQSNITFDVYSYNVHEDVKVFLDEFNNSKINFFEHGVDYLEIPNLLQRYDVGVILHKAYNENYKFNATNKLFEYLICDLDVWFPNEMLGCKEFSTTNTWPRVIGLDFKKLDKCNMEILKEKNNLIYSQKHFFYEDVFEVLANILLK